MVAYQVAYQGASDQEAFREEEYQEVACLVAAYQEVAYQGAYQGAVCLVGAYQEVAYRVAYRVAYQGEERKALNYCYRRYG